MIFVKSTVLPKILVIQATISNSIEVLKLPATTVTSGNDSKHMRNSKHYSYNALDFRTKHYTKDQKSKLIIEARRRAGKDYQFILEDEGDANEHLHVEYDPITRNKN